jgi:hypothetical protein
MVLHNIAQGGDIKLGGRHHRATKMATVRNMDIAYRASGGTQA